MSVPRAEPAPSEPPPSDGGGELTVDQLAASAADPLQVVLFDAFEVGQAGDPVREPHRHDYHELIWIRKGSGRHLLDGREVAALPGSITVIGRGQVHVLERAEAVTGAVVRFGEELVNEGGLSRAEPSFLLAGCGGWSVTVPRGHHDAVDQTIALLAAEAAGPQDAHSSDLQRHLLSVLLGWIERWYDAERTERRDPDDAGVQLFRRFVRALERDFASHHDAAHYADALGVPAAALSQALNRVTGRSTKELVLDRVMLEAARLLRFTDRTIGEISWATGFGDQLYFSRAFKRHQGLAPSAYRDSTRGGRPTG
ncbi:MAG TPA: AraC family transcriptional regulator [Solirubrobacteraceae bacterium]|nr:AraC family transcriptional regulator [Solirubrobacteraceae bacterium]